MKQKYKIIAFVIATTSGVKSGKLVNVKTRHSAPQYHPLSLPKQQVISEEHHAVHSQDICFLVKIYSTDAVIVEGTAEVADIFSPDAFRLREAMIDTCHAILKKYGGQRDLSEEYSIAVVSGYTGDPEQFFDKADRIASFLKSEMMLLDEEEVHYTLSKPLKYAKEDLVIVDWDGAFIFDPDGDVEPMIYLFQAANFQLLKYRIIDRDLDNRLELATKKIKEPSKRTFTFRHRELALAFREVIKFRVQSISEFNLLNREVKLVGDWYSARLYEAISKKFRLEEWRQIIKDKLESFEDIYTIISENFSISRYQRLELVQIGFFFVLQVGWFILILLEFRVLSAGLH